MKDSVTLSSNGKYWQARFYDHTGQRRAKSLCAKSECSERQARALCQRFAADLMSKPGLATAKSMRLADMIEGFRVSASHLSESSRKLHEMSSRYLLQFFGPDARIDRFTRAMARDFGTALSNGKLAGARRGGKRALKAPATLCKHVRIVKVLFNRAVDDDLLPFNPFDKLKSNPPER